MRTVPIFAGLGSEQIFAARTTHQAFRDAKSPHGQLLIDACHAIFLHEVSLALAHDGHGSLAIDLDHFQRPADMITPLEQYHSHPVVQHAILALVQLLRYQQRRSDSTEVTAGFCAGLLTAVAAASSRTALDYLARAEQSFRAAVLLGIAIQRAKIKVRALPTPHSWCLIVANADEDEITELASKYSTSKGLTVPIYISSKNSNSCVTISGEGEALHDFAETQLPSNCLVKPTNVFAMYHSSHLESCRDWMCEEFSRRGLAFPGHQDLQWPVISTLNGELIDAHDAPSEVDLLKEILDMIFVARTEWVAVQQRLQKIASSRSDDQPLHIHNFGPSYGVPNDFDVKRFEVYDVSETLKDEEHSKGDIAIVGVGLDLPDAPDPASLWENLMNSVNSCSEIPIERFDFNDYYTQDADPSDTGRTMGTKFGNFLRDAFLFDNQLFGISPREAATVDPQQRILLQTVYRALENAGYVPDATPSFARETFGCYVGNATLDYVDNLEDDIDVYYSPGTLRAFLSGRLSYVNGWSGPSVTVDTACSSSIVALHQASQAILSGECRAAVVGGINLITSPDMYLGLDRAYFLSPSGQCKPFDVSADGYCRGEGCAAFVIKKLEDAIEENDRILGVVKGTAINQSGHASSITHPHPPTQADLFRRLLETSSMCGSEISVVEAHGTGTAAGDPNELKSIREVFRSGGNKNVEPLYIGSIKANIGHLEAASGGASLAKLLLMLQHQQIPPQLLCTLNPAIEDLDSDGTVITTEASDWSCEPGRKRTALLNNFGAAGSNAALLLQEFAITSQRTGSSKETAYVFACSARSKNLLEQWRGEMLAHLSAHETELNLADICYTSTARRSLSSYRISLVASSIDELSSNIESAQIFESPDKTRPVVFLFSGQGSQFLGMGKDLYNSIPEIKKTMEYCHDLLLEWSYPSGLAVILSEEDQDLSAQSDDILQAFQTALFMLEVAIARFLMRLGINPAVVVGHSLGEYAALVVAGALDLQSGLWLVAQRASLIVERCQLWKTSMLAVNMSGEQVRKEVLSQEQFADLEISCENSPSACVVGGSATTLAELKEHIVEKLEQKCSLLNVPVAYHTTALDPVVEKLKDAATRVWIRPHAIPVASNVLGKVVHPDESAFTSQYFADHCRSTVKFSNDVDSILASKDDFKDARWIEIGPHPALLTMIASQIPTNAAEMLPTLKKSEHASRTLAKLFASCYQDDQAQVKWRAVFDGAGARMCDLPPAPMDRQKYFVPFRGKKNGGAVDAPEIAGRPTEFTVLEFEVEPVVDALATFETPLAKLSELVNGHRVCGSALTPASVYAEFALSAISHLEGHGRDEQILKLNDMKFPQPLILSEESLQIVRTNLVSKQSEKISFEISSFTKDGPSISTCHCTGFAKWQSLSRAHDKVKGMERSFARRKAAIEKGEHQTFTSITMYEKIFSRVVDYSPVYRSVKKIWLDETAEEAFAVCSLPSLSGTYAGEPVFLDSMLHVAGFAANFNMDNDSVCIAHHVRSVSILRKNLEGGMEFEIHCSNVVRPSEPDTVIAEVHAMDADGIIAVIKGMKFQRTQLAKIEKTFIMVAESLRDGDGKRSPATGNCVERALERPDGEEGQTREEQTNLMADKATTQGDSTPAKSSPGIAPKTETPTAVDILAETTGVHKKDITPQTDLSALGVDSMMIFELKNKLKEATHERPSVAELTAAKTVGEFEKLASRGASSSATPRKGVNSARKTDSRQQYSSRESDQLGPRANGPSKKVNGATPNNADDARACALDLPEEMIQILHERLGMEEQPEEIQLKPGSSQPSLWLIHSGAGMCNFYRRMADLGRNVYAIHDPRIFSAPEDDWLSVQDIVEHYAGIIDEGHSSDRLILGGWSFGAVVAFEIARLLLESGRSRVKGVILIDPPPPLDHSPMSRETIAAATAKYDSHQSGVKSENALEFENALKTLIMYNNERRGALLGQFEPKRRGAMPRAILLRSSDGLQASGDPPPGDAWLYDRSDRRKSIGPWEELTGSTVECIDIPGDHFTPFEPGKNIEGTSTAIRKACEMLVS